MLDKILRDSLYVHKEVKENEVDSAENRWQNKEVLNSETIYLGSLDNVYGSSCTVLTLDNEFVKKSSHSLKMTASTDIENVTPRPWPSIHVKLNNKDLSKYNRVACDIYIRAVGYQNFYVQFSFGNKGSEITHAPSLIPNQWNHVIWEVSDTLRDSVEEIIIGPWLMGTPPEGLPLYEFYLDNITMEEVVPDRIEGWNIDSDIAYCHAGYFTDSRKIALTGINESKEFKLYKDDILVLTKELEEISNELGKFYLMDFSEIKEQGRYLIEVNNKKSKYFEISNNAFDTSVWMSMNFLRLLRCGEDIPGVHSACHLNCKTVDKNGNMVPNFGGWHDAGDVSQFEIPTAEMAHAVVDLALSYKEKDEILYERLKEEARVGLNWLLRTRFGNGERAMAVTYNIWRHNVLASDNKTVYNNTSEDGPFENFCSSAALAKAYLLYKEEDKVFADWCLRAAKEDFEFAKNGYAKGIHTKRWGPNVDSQVSGHGAIAACELYEVTKDKYYIDVASEYAKTILLCQQRDYPDWDIPLRGFFYEDPQHTWVLTYEHRGHEQSPVQGLTRLCEVAPNHPDYSNWLEGLNLYREYIIKSLEITKPYGLLPGHVYISGKINPERFTIPKSYAETTEIGLAMLEKQATTGKKLADGVYLRIFPIAIQRRGYHATLLSKTKAVSAIAKVLNDGYLRQVAIDQLEWVLGKNPFASSTMYGYGYNYHPLYVAFSRQMVGALPVGIMTNGDHDLPYWPTRDNAVFKEIWGHTTGKYLWILSDIIDMNNRSWCKYE